MIMERVLFQRVAERWRLFTRGHRASRGWVDDPDPHLALTTYNRPGRKATGLRNCLSRGQVPGREGNEEDEGKSGDGIPLLASCKEFLPSLDRRDDIRCCDDCAAQPA